MTPAAPSGRRRFTRPALVLTLLTALLAAAAQFVSPSVAGALVYGPQVAYGLPPGTPLTPSGPLTITIPGQVIDSLDINGCVKVLAPNVTIVRSRITCSGQNAIVSQAGVQGMNIISSLLQGGADPAGTGVWSDGAYAVIDSEITNVTDGVFLSTGSTVQGSWIHGLTNRPGEHNDLIQMVGGRNAFIRNNLLEHRKGETSAIMIKSDLAPIDDLIIENNVIAGGGFAVYVMAGNALGGCCDAPTNVRIWNNVIRNGTYTWGPLMAMGPAVVLCNKMDTGEPLTWVASTAGANPQANTCPYAY